MMSRQSRHNTRVKIKYCQLTEPAAGSSLLTHSHSVCCRKLEALVWVVAAVGFLYWGDGEHSTYSLLSLPSAIRWGYLWGALAGAGINAGTFLYVQLYLRLYKGVYDDPELSTPWAVPLACASCILAWVLCCFAGWGVWGWFTPVVLSVEAIGSVMFLCHFMPAIARYKTPLPVACSESA